MQLLNSLYGQNPNNADTFELNPITKSYRDFSESPHINGWYSSCCLGERNKYVHIWLCVIVHATYICYLSCLYAASIKFTPNAY